MVAMHRCIHALALYGYAMPCRHVYLHLINLSANVLEPTHVWDASGLPSKLCRCARLERWACTQGTQITFHPGNPACLKGTGHLRLFVRERVCTLANVTTTF